MGDFSYRIMNACLGSELIPASLRRVLMRLAGFKMGKSACVWAGASFRSNRASLGDHVFINVGFFYDGHSPLVIENNVRIGQFVRIITATHDIGPPEQRCLIEAVGKPVHIGAGSWIGTGVTILPGVTVAPGCVLAANALLTRSTQPNGLYAGSPARRIRDLPV